MGAPIRGLRCATEVEVPTQLCPAKPFPFRTRVESGAAQGLRIVAGNPKLKSISPTKVTREQPFTYSYVLTYCLLLLTLTTLLLARTRENRREGSRRVNETTGTGTPCTKARCDSVTQHTNASIKKNPT